MPAYVFPLGQLFGDGTDALGNWIFLVLSAANDKRFFARVADTVYKEFSNPVSNFDTVHAYRVAWCFAYQGAELLMTPPNAVRQEVQGLMDRTEGVKRPYNQMCRFMERHGASLKALRDVTFHYIQSPGRRGKNPGYPFDLAGILKDNADEEGRWIETDDDSRFICCDDVYRWYMARVFGRSLNNERQMKTFHNFMDSVGDVSFRLARQYLIEKELRGELEIEEHEIEDVIHVGT